MRGVRGAAYRRARGKVQKQEWAWLVCKGQWRSPWTRELEAHICKVPTLDTFLALNPSNNLVRLVLLLSSLSGRTRI